MVESFDEVLIVLAHFVMGMVGLIGVGAVLAATSACRLIPVSFGRRRRPSGGLLGGLVIERYGYGRDRFIGPCSGRSHPLLEPRRNDTPKDSGGRFSVPRFDL
ncbi:MAG: hypothetical protein GXP27_07905 [Planctomycetes bacterium]|nr:hypothetical protein [Planctomycetota bacterium]